MKIPEISRCFQFILFVEYGNDRFSLRTELTQCLIDNKHLGILMRIGSIDHMDDDIRVFRFFQCALKCLYQMMWELPDKSDRITEQDLLCICQPQRACRRIQRGKQHRIL